jgi:hypothetical protein
MIRKFLLFFFLILASCSAPLPPSAFTATLPAAQVDLQAVLVPSELVLGLNRFAVGLIEPGKGPIKDAQVQFQYFDLSNPSTPTVESQVDARQIVTPDGLTTFYANEREFKRAGDWGVEVQTRLADGRTSVQRVKFTVLASSATKKIGDTAPNIETPIAETVSNDLTKLTSSDKPNPAFYKTSLANAIKNGKPTVLVFATPAFCQTRFCGPVYDVVSALGTKFGDAFNWVHVEVYTGLPNPAVNNWQIAPAMRAFGLTTEPWVYLVDARGIIAYRVEGFVTSEELEPKLKMLIGP